MLIGHWIFSSPAIKAKQLLLSAEGCGRSDPVAAKVPGATGENMKPMSLQDISSHTARCKAAHLIAPEDEQQQEGIWAFVRSVGATVTNGRAFSAICKYLTLGLRLTRLILTNPLFH